jgi:hypothetical protein
MDRLTNFQTNKQVVPSIADPLPLMRASCRHPRESLANELNPSSIYRKVDSDPCFLPLTPSCHASTA